MESTNPYRLPTGVRPQRYELTLRPDLSAATFGGRVRIEATVDAPTTDIVMNAIELEIRSARITRGRDSTEATVSLDDELERLTLTVTDPIPAGPVVIDLAFTGILNDKLRGFYRSTYTDDDGVEHTIATTQFESTDARRCFPCWDEPACKAVFGVALEVNDDLLAISAMSETERSQIEAGLVRVEFAQTPPMSTYLLAFVVGELEATPAVDVDGVALRIVHRPGRDHETAFALDAAEFSLGWLTDYFGVPYFGDKIDLVAIPDFASGAMENTGCLTFREVYLLLDEQTATQPEQQVSVAVIAHELAHMWFGNLVTMDWWEGLWLKEAFATFMETSTSNAYRPEWRIWESFALYRSEAFAVDSLHSTRAIEYEVGSPEEADGMYDVLTYEKGASVVRMLEQFVGADVFRDGIRNYIHTHAFGNTVTRDLWDAIESAASLPVDDIMERWIYTGGFPLIDARLADDEVALAQRPFRLLEATEPAKAAADADLEWNVPVTVEAGAQLDKVLMVPQGRVHLDDPDALVIVDPHSHGFFRTRYDPTLAARLRANLMSLTSSQRYRLFDDTFGLVLAGLATAEDYVELSRGLVDETSHPVWSATAEAWTTMAHMAGDRRRQQAIGALWSEIAGPQMRRLGFEKADDETDPLINEVRAILFGSLGSIGHSPEVIAHARGIHDGSIATDNVSIEGAAARVMASTGERAAYDAVFERYRSASSVLAKRRYLLALPRFDDSSAIDDLCRRTLDGSIRSQDAGLVLGRGLANRWHGAAVWDFITESWDDITAAIPDNLIGRMLSGIEWLAHDGVDQRVQSFLAEHDVPQAAMMIDQHLERLKVHVAFARRLPNEI